MAGLFSRTAASNATVRSSLAQVNQPGVWTDVARQFLVAQKVASKKAGVRLTKSATTTALELLAAANPAVAEAMSRELVPVAVQAFDAWPIRQKGGIRKTADGKDRLPGYSKSLLFLLWKAHSSTRFSASLVNRADYAAAILGGDVGEKLIFKPGRAAAVRAGARIARELGRR